MTAATYIEVQSLFNPGLLEEGPCCARVNGKWVNPGYELLIGDVVVITRYVDPARQRPRTGARR